jgi:hypothetical protein
MLERRPAGAAITDVFICYARPELDFARHIAEALRERTTDMFVDLGEWWHDDAGGELTLSPEEPAATKAPDGAAPNAPEASTTADASQRRANGSPAVEAAATVRTTERTNEVHAAITGATAVLVVVSSDLATSSRCRHEIERAVALRKRIVLVGAAEKPVPALPEELRSHDVLPISADDFESTVKRLIEVLEADAPRMSFWASVHARRWTLLGFMALASLALGLWGYADLYPTAPFLDRLYAAFGLFRDSTTIYSLGGATTVVTAPPFPWPLEVARWFAPPTLVLAGLSAVFAVLAEPFTRVRIHVLYRRHLVVCGIGHFGLRLATAFQARGERVVVVDCNPSSVALSRCRERSIPVLVGDATDPEILRQAGVGRATRVVAVCGDNTVNDRIGVAVKRVVATDERLQNRRRRLDCFLHVDDDQMCERLEQSSLADANRRGVSLNYVNVFRSGGLALLGEFPHSFAGRDGRAPHVIVVGPDRVGMLLVAGAVREWWFDHRDDGLRLGLTLVASDAKQRIHALRRRYPHFDEACHLVAVSCDPADPASPELPPLVHEDDWGVTTVFVTYADERESLEAVMQLANSMPSFVPIVALTAGQTGPVTLLDRAATQLHLSNVTTFPLLDRLCRPDVFVNSVTEQMARALHGNYLRHRRLDGTYDPTRESHKPWEVLKETYRDSNRDSAAHLSSRLDEVGYSVQVSDDWAVALPTFSHKDMDRLAQSEHLRWCEERLADGWTRGPEIDPRQKRHPDLVAWDELGESRRELDREAQRELPVLLARYGLAIVRKPQNRRETPPSQAKP